ncbi:hypothetical protein TNCV_1293121 [Trichonephila clavipes]|nr:hypothetical protein TNCV_1293121 [Trichonephila clavipes]
MLDAASTRCWVLHLPDAGCCIYPMPGAVLDESRSFFRVHTGYFSNIRTATAGSDVVQSGRPIFDDFFQHLWPYIGNNTANVVLQMAKRLWLIRIDQ